MVSNAYTKCEYIRGIATLKVRRRNQIRLKVTSQNHNFSVFMHPPNAQLQCAAVQTIHSLTAIIKNLHFGLKDIRNFITIKLLGALTFMFCSAGYPQ